VQTMFLLLIVREHPNLVLFSPLSNHCSIRKYFWNIGHHVETKEELMDLHKVIASSVIAVIYIPEISK